MGKCTNRCCFHLRCSGIGGCGDAPVVFDSRVTATIFSFVLCEEHYMASVVSECVPFWLILALWLVDDIFFSSRRMLEMFCRELALFQSHVFKYVFVRCCDLRFGRRDHSGSSDACDSAVHKVSSSSVKFVFLLGEGSCCLNLLFPSNSNTLRHDIETLHFLRHGVLDTHPLFLSQRTWHALL